MEGCVDMHGGTTHLGATRAAGELELARHFNVEARPAIILVFGTELGDCAFAVSEGHVVANINTYYIIRRRLVVAVVLCVVCRCESP